MKILAIIPARAGSKGVPNKNIREISGKPLIGYTIEEAIKSKKISKIVVSSDSEKIIKLSKKYGVETIQRPKKYSTDSAPMISVISHVINKKNYSEFDHIILLQPTCPLRTCKDIDLAIGKYGKNKVDSLISVYKVEDSHPSRMYKIKNNRLCSIQKKDTTKNRQDLNPIYLRNGAIYITKKKLIKEGKIWGGSIFPYLMSKEKSLNIDDMSDFQYAKYLIE